MYFQIHTARNVCGIAISRSPDWQKSQYSYLFFRWKWKWIHIVLALIISSSSWWGWSALSFLNPPKEDSHLFSSLKVATSFGDTDSVPVSFRRPFRFPVCFVCFSQISVGDWIVRSFGDGFFQDVDCLVRLSILQIAFPQLNQKRDITRKGVKKFFDFLWRLRCLCHNSFFFQSGIK